MLKRLCSLFLILALLFTLLPAQADIAPLTAQEIATVRAFIAMEGEGSSWQRGMAVTPQMNAQSAAEPTRPIAIFFLLLLAQ